MKINIFVRHCFYSSNSDKKANVRPRGFSLKICHENLKRTASKYGLDITCLLDVKNRNGEYFIESDGSKVIEHIGGTDATSFTNLLNHVSKLNLNSDDLVYFVEDDYFHVDDWPLILADAFEIPQVDYVTLYDHADKYFGMLPMYNSLTSKIYCGNMSHWRVVPNTTNTYAMKFRTLMNDLEIHYKYSKPELQWTRDAEKFAELSSHGRTLVSPIPGYSTHLENPYMSPLIDWEYLIEEERKK